MEPITRLRQLARERRDKTVSEANSLYVDTMKRIAAIELDLLGNHGSGRPQGIAVIQQAMPADRPFNSLELRASLEALDPRRLWNRGTISNLLGRLHRKGYIRRLRRCTNQSPAVYVRAGVETEHFPVEANTLPDAAERLLREAGRPMTPMELALTLRDSGYPSKMNLKHLRASLGRTMRGYPERFKVSRGKWSLRAISVSL